MSDQKEIMEAAQKLLATGRYKHLGDGLHKDTVTGKFIDEEIIEENKSMKPRVIGTLYPDALSQLDQL